MTIKNFVKKHKTAIFTASMIGAGIIIGMHMSECFLLKKEHEELGEKIIKAFNHSTPVEVVGF